MSACCLACGKLLVVCLSLFFSSSLLIRLEQPLSFGKTKNLFLPLRWWLVASQPPELTVDTESETGKAVLR